MMTRRVNLPLTLPTASRSAATLEALPGKKPLIKLSHRPPNYETPIEYLGTAITPNDAFFVRCNLSEIPRINAKTWKVFVGGEGAVGQAELTLDDLKKIRAFEVTAVCQCSGNRRDLFRPRVAGVQWGHGAVGCARWKGVSVKDVLDKVGLRKEAIEIVLDGADQDLVENTPDFIKSIPVWKAAEETTLIAYEMNGQPLPYFNGFPARVIVPGWTATYWVKQVTSIAAVSRPFDGYWMKSTYRLPLGKFPAVARFVSQETAVDTPITEMMVNSLITSPADGASAKVGSKVTVGGIAWDGGYGIRDVEVSIDAGKTWTKAVLGQDLGRFAFRRWSFEFMPRRRGRHMVIARATNMIGQGQTTELILNPAGYHHNLMPTVALIAM